MKTLFVGSLVLFMAGCAKVPATVEINSLPAKVETPPVSDYPCGEEINVSADVANLSLDEGGLSNEGAMQGFVVELHNASFHVKKLCHR